MRRAKIGKIWAPAVTGRKGEGWTSRKGRRVKGKWEYRKGLVTMREKTYENYTLEMRERKRVKELRVPTYRGGRRKRESGKL